MSGIVLSFFPSSSFKLSGGCSDCIWLSLDNGNVAFFRKQRWFNTGCWTSFWGFFSFLLWNFPVPSLCLLFELLTSCPPGGGGEWQIPAETPMKVWDTAVVPTLMKKRRAHATFSFRIKSQRRFHSPNINFPTDSFCWRIVVSESAAYFYMSRMKKADTASPPASHHLAL